MSVDLTKIFLVSFYTIIILFISTMILNTKDSPVFLGLSVFMLIMYSYGLGNFLGRDKEIETCYSEKELLIDAERVWLKAVNKHAGYIAKMQIYEYKGRKYILLDIVKLKPTTESSGRGWVDAVVYTPLGKFSETYVREKDEFFRRFKRVM